MDLYYDHAEFSLLGYVPGMAESALESTYWRGHANRDYVTYKVPHVTVGASSYGSNGWTRHSPSTFDGFSSASSMPKFSAIEQAVTMLVSSPTQPLTHRGVVVASSASVDSGALSVYCDSATVNGALFDALQPQSKVLGASDMVVSEYVVPRKRLRKIRGVRGGFYTKAKHQYAGIIGISQEQYAEICCAAQVHFFGKNLTETHRAVAGRVVSTIADEYLGEGKLPRAQQIKLLVQVWADLTVGETHEEHLDNYLDENRDAYWSRYHMRTGAVRQHWLARLVDNVKRVLNPWYDPAPPGLPRN